MAMIEIILTSIRQDLEDLYDEKLSKIILFGSQARKSSHEDSDIDLLIVLKGDVNPNFEIDKMSDIIYSLNLKYDVLISVLPVSEKEYEKSKISLYSNIKSEGIPIE